MTGTHTDLDEVFERIDDAFFALDEEWRFTFLNDQAEEFLNVDREAVVGEVVWDEFEAAAGTTFQEEYERAMETQEPVSFEEHYPPLGMWFEVNAYPSETGLSVYFRDVSDRVERERELERYEAIVETVQDGIYVVDDGTFTMVNDAYADLVGYSREELLGSDVSLVVDEAAADTATTIEGELAAGDRSTATVEATLEQADGDTLEAEATFAMIPDNRRVAVVRDITDRKERERNLERYERIVETVEDGVYAVDENEQFVLVNDALCEMTGYSREELLGAPASILYSEDMSEGTRRLLEAVTRGDQREGTVEVRMRRKDGEMLPIEVRFRALDLGDVSGRCGVVRDITERAAYERRLVALHDVARDLLRTGSDDDIAAVTTDALVDILDAPAAGYYQYDPETETLSPSRVADEENIVDIDLPSVPTGDGSLTGSVFERKSTKLVADLSASPEANERAAEIGIRSGVFAPVGDHGVLVAASTDVDAFDEETRQLVEIVATTAAVAADRIGHERMLRRQHERLAALSDIDSLVHGLSESLFDLSTQSDIESRVCRRLAESDSYEFALIGTVEGGVGVNAAAGEEGFVADLPTDESPLFPDGRPDEVRVARDVPDEFGGAWGDHAREYGYRSVATIPVVDGDGYGALTVYTDRVNAFGDEERDALRRLGSVVAHALTAIERDRELQLERDRLNFVNRLLRHNLLNSLNVVSARLGFLDGRVDEDVAHHLDTAADRTDEMMQFVETVRSLTRAIGNDETQELDAVDVGEVLQRRVERARSIYPVAEFHLESAPPVAVVADDLLGEVLDNVLVNAVQHNTRDDPEVWVDFALGDEEVVISVADNGPGISDERKERLFDRGATTFDDPTSGFGLFLVAQILDSYGGDIAVEDNDPEGTVFRLTFQRG